MNSSTPVFDSSKPFTTEAPQFDPSKPFTPERAKAPTFTSAESTSLTRLEHGFEAPFVGLNELASQIEGYLPGVSKQTAASDLAASQRQKREFERQGTPGFSGMELAGNLLNPLNYAGFGLGRGVTLAGTLGRAAASGAASSLVQPEHGLKDIAAGAAGGAAAGAAARPISQAISAVTPKALDAFIQQQFTRAIKPSVSGKQTYGRAKAYDEGVLNAIGAVAANKGNLRLVDAAGQTSTRLPQSLDEFSQAIEQTKKDVFQRYDAMTKAAGKVMDVTVMPIVKELRSLSSSKVIRDLSPSVGNYADALADRLDQRGQYSTEEAQAAIQHLNASLRGHYTQAPTRETTGAAGVDSLIANKLRDQLDKTIEKSVGKGYQALKNTYGALRKLEKDVVHRTIVTSRQELGGGLMGRMSDVVSADEVIRGLLRLDPTAVAVGGGLRAWRSWVRHLRDPNRAVSRIFDAAEKKIGYRPSPTREAIAAGVQGVAPVAGALGVNQEMTPKPSRYSDTMRRAAQPVSPPPTHPDRRSENTRSSAVQAAVDVRHSELMHAMAGDPALMDHYNKGRTIAGQWFDGFMTFDEALKMAPAERLPYAAFRKGLEERRDELLRGLSPRSDAASRAMSAAA